MNERGEMSENRLKSMISKKAKNRAGKRLQKEGELTGRVRDRVIVLVTFELQTSRRDEPRTVVGDR